MAYKVIQYGIKLVKEKTLTLPITRITQEEDAERILHHLLKNSPMEEMAAVFINAASEIAGVQLVARGGSHGMSMTSKDVFRGAIAANAYALVLGHNHPSQSFEPSVEDIEFTRHMVKVGKELGVPIFDHFIVTRAGCRSFFDRC